MSVTNTRNNLCIAFMGFYKAHTQPSFPSHPPAYYQQTFEVIGKRKKKVDKI